MWPSQSLGLVTLRIHQRVSATLRRKFRLLLIFGLQDSVRSTFQAYHYFLFVSQSRSSRSGHCPLCMCHLSLSFHTQSFLSLTRQVHRSFSQVSCVRVCHITLFYWPDGLYGFLPSFLEDRARSVLVTLCPCVKQSA